MTTLPKDTVKVQDESYAQIVKRLEKSCDDMRWYLSHSKVLWREEVVYLLKHRERELKYFKKLHLEEQVAQWTKKNVMKKLCWYVLSAMFGRGSV